MISPTTESEAVARLILVISELLDCGIRLSVSYWPGENTYNSFWYSVTGDTLLQSGHFLSWHHCHATTTHFHHASILGFLHSTRADKPHLTLGDSS